jgi:hypothetical protein
VSPSTFSQLVERVTNLTKDVEALEINLTKLERKMDQKASYLQKTMIGLLVTIAASAVVAFLTVLVGLGRL